MDLHFSGDIHLSPCLIPSLSVCGGCDSISLIPNFWIHSICCLSSLVHSCHITEQYNLHVATQRHWRSSYWQNIPHPLQLCKNPKALASHLQCDPAMSTCRHPTLPNTLPNYFWTRSALPNSYPLALTPEPFFSWLLSLIRIQPQFFLLHPPRHTLNIAPIWMWQTSSQMQ